MSSLESVLPFLSETVTDEPVQTGQPTQDNENVQSLYSIGTLIGLGIALTGVYLGLKAFGAPLP